MVLRLRGAATIYVDPKVTSYCSIDISGTYVNGVYENGMYAMVTFKDTAGKDRVFFVGSDWIHGVPYDAHHVARPHTIESVIGK